MAHRWSTVRAVLIVALVVGVIGALTSPIAFAAAAVADPLALPQDKPVAVTPVKGAYRKPPAIPKWSAHAVTWPTGSADLPVTTGQSAKAALPLTLAPDGAGPSTVHATVAPRAAATAAGVNGVVLSLHGNDSDSGTVHVSVDYTPFADAFGGDWASRLTLVGLPACALTTPNVPKCRQQTPLPSTNDEHAGTVAADVPLAAANAANTVVAATSATSGGGGDYTATSLKPAGSWTAGGAADSFTWSYPLQVPPVPGGLTPQVALSYNSQSVDGLTSGTNNQASWIGDGWDYSPGFVERSYTSCHNNPAGTTKTWDNCWSPNNPLKLSINGQTNVLVPDNTTPGLYHPQNDNNEQVRYFGQPNQPNKPGNEYFVVTTDDGTQYFFGKNQLPGWTGGNPVTNSVWNEPVYSTTNGQPCYSATFSGSECEQPYRWNLDYVKDTHGDVISYFYSTETNFYASDLGNQNGTAPPSSAYVRGGYLAKITYGQRDQQEFTSTPAAQIVFTTTGRCNQATCDPAGPNAKTASQWPDVPFDVNCASGAKCEAQGPSFWSEQMLTTIQAQALQGTTESTVDTWTLDHSFPAVADANTTPSLWLAGITHKGEDPADGGSTAELALPEIQFAPIALNNRVNATNGLPWITRNRITQITTETDEMIKVQYNTPTCSVPVEPSTNQTACYPVYWTPTDQTAPVRDWFNMYTVQTVTEEDPTDGSANDDIVTTYTPVGNPAWHYDDNPTTPVDQRTWNQWRGYAGLTVSTGHDPDPITKTAYTYFRGMNGDTLPNNGTRSATVTDLHGDPAATDANQFAGWVYDTVVYDGDAVVTDTVNDPYTSAATASANVSGFPALQSFHVGTTDTKVYTPLADGTTRETETDYTHDADGRVTATNDLGDTSIASDDLCATESYADDTGANILDLPAEQRTVSVACGTTPTQAQTVSDTQTFYDNATTLGASPTTGDVTKSQNLISYNADAGPNWATTTTTVDQYGRPTGVTNPDNRLTTTTYTPATGANPTSVAVLDPLKHKTTTTYDPLRNLQLTITDAANYVTSQQYDTLGRVTAVRKPGIDVPAYKFAYTVSNTGPSVVDSNTLEDDGTYRTSETLFDSLLRTRETQVQTTGIAPGTTANESGRDITDTDYDTDGWMSRRTDPYFATGPISPTYVQAQDGNVPSLTGYTYDGAGRDTAKISYNGMQASPVETWRTTFVNGGDSTTTIPPAGGTATTTITDARGRTTDLLTYHGGVPTDPVHDPAADYDRTHYTYTPAGNQATVKDASGATWTYGYDLLGNQTSAQDPDTGTTTATYDAASQQLTSTDARGKQTTTV
ncbi:MAG TPA: RHS repeat domain-containing protein, partial [Pseudonocardiaceae bacterium]|nr:RHS repeat domain-containing protein [Pseudonocardiaceae bacterium]